MTTHFLDWKRPGIPGLKPIREERRAIRLLIEACGFDRFGRFFTERTETLNVSASGCKFPLRTELASEAIVAIRVMNDCRCGAPPTLPILFRTVRAERSADGWSVAVTKLQQEQAWMDGLSAAKNHRASRAS